MKLDRERLVDAVHEAIGIHDHDPLPLCKDIATDVADIYENVGFCAHGIRLSRRCARCSL